MSKYRPLPPLQMKPYTVRRVQMELWENEQWERVLATMLPPDFEKYYYQDPYKFGTKTKEFLERLATDNTSLSQIVYHKHLEFLSEQEISIKNFLKSNKKINTKERIAKISNIIECYEGMGKENIAAYYKSCRTNLLANNPIKM